MTLFMGRFDDIKDKAQDAKEKAGQGVSDAREKAKERREKVGNNVKQVKESAGGSVSTVFGKVGDAKMKFKKPLREPETRKEGTLTTEKRFFICESCGTELGPIEEKQYSQLIKPALKGSKAIFGIATGNPIMAVSGAAGAARGASKAKSTDNGRLAKLPRKRIKNLKKNREEGSEFLTQCDSCIEWVCMDCWNADTGSCIDCT